MPGTKCKIEMQKLSLSIVYKAHRSKQENGEAEHYVEQGDAIELQFSSFCEQHDVREVTPVNKKAVVEKQGYPSVAENQYKCGERQKGENMKKWY